MNERKKIFELLQKKRVTCKTCSNFIVRSLDDIVTSRVSSSEDLSSIFHVLCTSCTKKRRGQLFCCVSCGRINRRSAKMIKNNGCKCCIVHDTDPAADVRDLARPIASVCFCGDVPTMFDFEDPEMNPDPDNVCAEFHSTEVGWELDDLDDLDAVVTEQNDDNMFKMPAVFRAEEFFIKENGWSNSSRSYLINEHNDRTGLKGIVYKALIDHQRMSGFESLSEEEVHFHLLSTIIHYNSSRNESINICSMLEHLTIEKDQLLDKNSNLIFLSMQKHLCTALENTIPDHTVERMLEHIQERVREDLGLNHINMQQSPRVTLYKEVRAKYLDGTKSIMQNLPMPSPSIKTLFPGTNKEISYAHIPANQILNHILALGYECYFHRAGYDEDWSECQNASCSISSGGDYHCEFFKDAHRVVKEMMTENPAMPKDTRVVILRVWSDGFEAHNVKGNTQFNSLQVFTIKLRGPKDQTLPYALCFKTLNVRKILVSLLEELNELRQLSLRYWGRDKQIIPTIALLELVSNDYPERCFNTGISQKGNYTKRFGHSCLFNKTSTPSCPRCQLQRMEIILSNSSNVSLEPCEDCTDWWARVERGNKYPISPGGDITKVIPVELSFELIVNSLKDLEDWYRENKGKGGASLYATKYMKLLGISGGLVDGKGLMWSLRNEKPLEESESYPEIFKCFKDLHIELNMFPSMPMHLCFLGIEKSLIDQTKNIILNGRKTDQAQFWKNLIQPMRRRQHALNKVSIDWCLPMLFSGEKNNDIGHANWQSDHCLSFTRISLFQFADLDGFSDLVYSSALNRVIASFKRMRVVWFCLISNMFCNTAVTAQNRVYHLIRMFLSCCKDFSEHSKEADCEPFFATQSNIFSLLNCPDIIKKYGSLGGIWEGEDEAFVRDVKSEISTMRYQTSHLLSVLVRLLKTKTLKYLNQNNPLYKYTAYARTNNVRIYSKRTSHAEVLTILEKEIFVSGIVDDMENLLICVEVNAGKGIKLIPLIFNDNNGRWCLNLWYAEVAIGPVCRVVQDRAELKDLCKDYFLMLRHNQESSLWTVICRSWCVRTERGILELPTPHKSILTIEECLQ